MKILMIAYACEPSAGGEPSVGWYWAVNAAVHGHRVIVLTRANNEPAINQGLELLQQEVADRLTFLYHDLGSVARRLKNKAGVFTLLAYYYVWQLAATGKLRAASRDVDLVHHVTFCNDSVFSVGALLGRPFLWGPTGGYTHTIPHEYLALLSSSARRYEKRRRMLQFALRYLDPLAHISRARAQLILTYSEEAKQAYSQRQQRRVQSIRHVGVPLAEIGSLKHQEGARRADDGTQLSVATAGRLVHWKGFDLAIEAIAAARARGLKAVLYVVGDGPERGRLEELAREKSVKDYVRFLGRLPEHADVLATIASADVFLQPTLRDGPPVAILEAMSKGTLVVTAAFGANAELVPSDAGVVIGDTKDREALVENLGTALLWARDNRGAAADLSQACLEHVRQYRSWESIGRVQSDLYRALERQ